MDRAEWADYRRRLIESRRWADSPEAKRPAPRVRLSRVMHRHAQIIELMRILARKESARFDQFPVYEEMVRRGVMPERYLVRVGTSGMPTPSGRQVMDKCVNMMLDMGLIELKLPGVKRHRFLYTLTEDGMETLMDWDDPNSDGVYARAS